MASRVAYCDITVSSDKNVLSNSTDAIFVDMRIRDFFPEDIVPLTQLYNHYIQETTITFDLQPYTVEQRQRQWMSHYRTAGRYRLLVAENEQKNIVGYVTSSQLRVKAAYDTSVETSIYLHPEATGKGIGSQLYNALFMLLAKEDIHRAYACITLPNPTSIAMHQKFGFEQVGLFCQVGRKFGQYWDVAWLEKHM